MHETLVREPTKVRRNWSPDGVNGVTADSREVRDGWLFAAIPGTRQDGRRFIPEAIARGATAVLTTPGSATGPAGIEADSAVPAGVSVIEDPEPRRRLAQFAAKFFGQQPRSMALVTGTNGKTSTVEFTRQIWETLGSPAASVGTLGIVAEGLAGTAGLTTPDPVRLYRTLAQLAAAGIQNVALEASSHGLAQSRLDAVESSIGAFTSFSRDHLDYHENVEDYLEAKLALFARVIEPGGSAIINADDPVSEIVERRARARRHTVITHGTNGLWIQLLDRMVEETGQILRLRVMGKPMTVRLPLVGDFQASNAMAAALIAIADGADPADTIAALETLTVVRGRMEMVGRHPNGAPVYVDYSHTPDALAKALDAIRPHVRSRLSVVFGAGGDRDPGKRVLMGEAARRHAETVVVTDDNPRSEDPLLIRKAILEGVPEALDIGDRRDAIGTAIRRLGEGDALLIAGKGHEQGQIVGDRLLPFDDATVAREVLAALRDESGETR